MMTLFLYGISSISPLSKTTGGQVLQHPNSPLVFSRSNLILVNVVFFFFFCKKKNLELKSSAVNSVVQCNYM